MSRDRRRVLPPQPIRGEPVIALLAQAHPLAGRQTLDLPDLAPECFLFFPRELAPRLYDVMVGLCRHAGFEPVATGESFHSGWELQILAEVDVLALVAASVASELPNGIAAVPVADPTCQLETAIVWRKDDPSPTVVAFREAAQTVFRARRPVQTRSSSDPPLPVELERPAARARKMMMRSYDRTREHIDAICASQRLKLPLKGIRVIH